jgi:mycoredoxin
LFFFDDMAMVGFQERSMAAIKVFGADWCEDTQRSLEQLDALGLDYDYFDVDEDPAAQAWVKEQNGGKQKTPTIDVKGKIVIEPSDEELEETLRERGFIA